MPGIFGTIQPRLNQDQVNHRLAGMASALETEERFSSDFYTENGFGFGRISLKILNPESQPVWTDDQSVGIVLEGEVYNADILRGFLQGKGRVLRSNNTAELLLQLYLEDGDTFAAQINGAFIAAIWDQRSQKLLITNDRLGLFPLYYAQFAQGFIFSSGVRALLADPAVSREVDRVALAEFLTFDHLLQHRTLLQSVQLLPQAAVLIYQNHTLSIQPYYRFEQPDTYPMRPEAEYMDEFIEAIRLAVHRQNSDNLTAGLMLSGGLDSRMLLAVFGEQSSIKPLHTFTWSIPGSDDARSANEAASLYPNIQHHFFELKPDWLLHLGEEGVRRTDGMGNIVNLHALANMKEESQFAQVIHKGFMGDAIMGFGIRPRFWADYDDTTRSEVHLEAYRDYNVLTFDLPEHPSLFTEDFQRQAGSGLMDDFKAGFQASGSRQLANQRIYFDLTQRVPRMTLNGVEMVRSRSVARVPFGDNDFVEFALTVPPWLRYERDLMTRAFIQAYPKLARVPLARTGLPMVSCGREILLRNWHFLRWHLQRMGLSSLTGPTQRPYKDYTSWFRGVLRPWVEQTLLNDRSLERGYFKPERIRQIVADHMAGKSQTVRIGALMSIEIWHRLFLD